MILRSEKGPHGLARPIEGADDAGMLLRGQRGRRGSAAALVMLAMALAGSAAWPAASIGASGPPARVPDRLSGDWARLRYTTSKLLIFSGEVNMTRSAGGETISIRTESEARLLGSPMVSAWSLSTLDRRTGRPLEFLDVNPGKRADKWAFTADGVEHARLRPRGKARDEPLETWQVSKRENFPLRPTSAPGAHAGGEAAAAGPQGAATAGVPAPNASGGSYESDPRQWVHDYISMIVRLRDLPLEKVGDLATVHVATSRGPAPMQLRVAAERTSRRKLTNLATGQSRELEIKELRLRATPLAGTASETRGFLNMEGETELWVDAASRTLTEISGHVPKVPGRVVITLSGYR